MNIFILIYSLLVISCTPVFAAGCNVDDETGTCAEGECKLVTGEVGLCSQTETGCECLSIHE